MTTLRTAVADLDEASAKTVAKERNATAYTDYRALLAKETLDAVVSTLKCTFSVYVLSC